MRKKNGFNLRSVCGEYIIVAEGKENIDFSKIISMNESAAFLWKNLGNEDFSISDMVNLLTSEYNVNNDTATLDCQKLVEQWRETGIIIDR